MKTKYVNSEKPESVRYDIHTVCPERQMALLCFIKSQPYHYVASLKSGSTVTDNCIKISCYCDNACIREMVFW